MNASTVASPASRSPRCESPGHPTGSARLRGRVEPIGRLGSREMDALHALLGRYFAGVTRAQFERDLAEKEWVLLLEDVTDGEIRGFSTLMRLYATVGGVPLVAFFSGDTIVDRDYWGETVLSRLWIRHVLDTAATTPELPAYWYLISSGYRTYRFLSTFFREFYPTYAAPTPEATRRILDTLGAAKFPREYDPAAGVVRLAGAAPLRAGVSDISPRELRDPHVAFFAAANRGHARGDELACLAALRVDNLTPAGRRMLR